MSNQLKFATAGLLLIIAVALLILTATNDSARYFLTIDELHAMGNSAQDRPLTISGAVLGSSITYDSTLPRVTFTLIQIPGDPQAIEAAGGLAAVLHTAVQNDTAPRIQVVYNAVKPDLLRNEAQAIVRGRLDQDGLFHADEVLLKCPSRYEEELPAQTENENN